MPLLGYEILLLIDVSEPIMRPKNLIMILSAETYGVFLDFLLEAGIVLSGMIFFVKTGKI